MAKGQYIGVNGVARKVKQPYIGVENVARKVKSGYIGVDNVARQFFLGGTPVGELEVGSSVYMNVDGVATEFLVVHQGLPDATLYDSSCEGTWLLMKAAYSKMTFQSSSNENVTSIIDSKINTYLNATFFNLLDVNIQGIIKQVKLPYTVGKSSSSSLVRYVGADGYDTKIFLLDANEIGASPSGAGSKLDYFIEGRDSSEANAQRIAFYIDGTEAWWWLRSMLTNAAAFYIYGTGEFMNNKQTSNGGVRPALILPSETLLDENFNVIA